jgi:hypothetical protein
MDGNFSLRLKLMKTKRNDADRELGPGWAYHVDDVAYRSTIAELQKINPKAAEVSV